jgi:hypothetical protein
MSDPKNETKPETKPKVDHPKVLVINNEERLNTMHVPSKQVIAGEPGDLLVLMPGVNIVDAEAIKACRANPKFDLFFKTKIPRHVAKEAVSERVGQPILVEGPRVPAHAPLSVLTDEEAEMYVEEASTVELLNVFRIGEGRQTVRAKIDDRIRHLETGGGEIEAST